MLNMNKSLDDLIQMNKSEGRRPPNSAGPGPARRPQNRSTNRAVPYSSRQVQSSDMNWQHDMFENHDAAFPYPRKTSIETGTKLIVSNLDSRVSEKDIMELFSDVGEMHRYSINYDRNGRSKGTAEVVYKLRRDAEAAIMRYYDVVLDGKRMKVETVGRNMPIPFVPMSPSAPMSFHGGRASGIRRPHYPRGGGGRFGRGGGGNENEKEWSSVKDLDADLDNYRAEAQQEKENPHGIV